MSLLTRLLTFAVVLVPAWLAAKPVLTIAPEKASGIYAIGEPIVWDVTLGNDPQGLVKSAVYDLKEAGAKPIGKGTITFVNGKATVQSSLAEPGTVLLSVATQPAPGEPSVMARGGAAVAYDRISRAVPRPSDFDAFWKTKLAEIANLPLNPALEKGDCEKPGVDYWKIKLDNVNGTHVQGQLARPSGTQKLPALLIVQYAGVYPLQKSWAVDHAAAGWLTLNVMAHDLPIDRPKSFYAEQAQNELKDYTTIGKTDRDKTYFLRMFLGDLQAAKYLEQRPDWDGKTLVVTGGSQGGMQSFAVAALDQKVTGMVVIVPAGADDSGALAGRNPGWPFHLVKPEDPTEKQVLQAISYYDPVNFASLIKCPALVAVGLIDEVAPPTGVFTAFNQLQGPKEILVMARSNHTGAGGTQAAFKVRSNEWFAALAAGKPAPVRAAQP